MAAAEAAPPTRAMYAHRPPAQPSLGHPLATTLK
jgi:hypothetical protein